MTLPELDNVMQQYSCHCRNITINAYDIGTTTTTGSDPNYQRILVGEHGIHIAHHCLLLRMRDRPQTSKTSPDKLLQHLALSCLACKTLAYRVAQEVSPGAEARQGPVIPTEDWIEQETLRSKSGWIEVFVGMGGCLVGKETIERHFQPLQLSDTFSIAVPSYPETSNSESVDTSESPLLHRTRSSTTDVMNSTLPDQILSSLPPLFPPPPFTPVHPAFLSLSARANAKSADLRQQTEAEIRSFIKSKLDSLEKGESILRNEVHSIWRGYLEGWKETLDRVNEERQHYLSSKSKEIKSSSTSGIPKSIRNFSPIESHLQANSQYIARSQSIPAPSTSLLSALIRSGNQSSTSSSPSPSPAPETRTVRSTAVSSSTDALNYPTTVPSRVNDTGSSGSPLPVPSTAHSDVPLPGAFKRNMDANLDVVSSMVWAQGEEELRRRYGDGKDGEPKERARKRTSKDLGIGAVETKPARRSKNPPYSISSASQLNPELIRLANSKAVAGSISQIRVEPHNSSSKDQVQTSHSQPSDGTRPGKRRVTFDVRPEVAVVPQRTTSQPIKHVPEVELFDLDDPTEPFTELELSRLKSARQQAVTRTPSYKLQLNDEASMSLSSQPASLPVSRVFPRRSSANGTLRWMGAPKRSVGLADALPLLSSSVPAGDRVLPTRSQDASAHDRQHVRSLRTLSPHPQPSMTLQIKSAPDAEPSSVPPTIPSTVIGPAEAELKHLLAASAPSHRHAWKEGGRAWQMFHQRPRVTQPENAIPEESGNGTSSSLDDASDISSDYSLTNNTWSNPSFFATSLPVQIRPLANLPRFEPKTSLAEKQGVLVPPLRVKRLNSATAIRKAMYAERDRTRSIDPGPTLDFNEQEETEEDVHDELGGEDRGRRHAFSILQARSVIPEAGMWRSMAS